MATTYRVKIINGALDETGDGDIILRGVIDPDTFQYIQVPPYQREPLPLPSRAGILEAFKSGGKVADVTLGMRGGDYLEDKKLPGVFHMRDEVVVIDGLQRITTALDAIRSGEKKDPHLGCLCYFNTSDQMERELFRVLNTSPTKLAPAILIRNLKDENEAVATIYSLAHDKTCALFERVCWQQRMKRGELMTALTLLKTIGSLHSGYGPCLGTQYMGISGGLLRVMRDVVGRNIFRENIRTFFDMIDGAWGIRNVAFKAEATWVRGNFMAALAQVLANHRNFWDSNRRLVIPPDIRKRLSTFPVTDPSIRAYSAGGGPGRKAIYLSMLDHLNSGKRTHRLVAFKESDTTREFFDEGEGVAVA